MVEIELTSDKLVIHVKGWDKLLAVRSTAEVELAHVTSVEAGVTDEAWEELQNSFRVGTAVGNVVAGSYRHKGEWMFWDIHDKSKAITIGVEHDKFKKLVVEVADPVAAIAAIRDRIKR